MQSGANLKALFGSVITSNTLSSSSLNGTITVDGSGSRLAVKDSALLDTTLQNVGGGGGTGALIFQNDSTTSSFAGALGIANAATAGTGTVFLTGGSQLSIAGAISLATQNVVGSSAMLNINSTNSSQAQTTDFGTTVRSNSNGTATVNIGTTSSGGTLTTCSDVMVVNHTGTVNVGGNGHTGTLNVPGQIVDNGAITVDGIGSNFNNSAGSNYIGRAPAETSTSTSTGKASIPNREKVCSLASMWIAPRTRPDEGPCTEQVSTNADHCDGVTSDLQVGRKRFAGEGMARVETAGLQGNLAARAFRLTPSG